MDLSDRSLASPGRLNVSQPALGFDAGVAHKLALKKSGCNMYMYMCMCMCMCICICKRMCRRTCRRMRMCICVYMYMCMCMCMYMYTRARPIVSRFLFPIVAYG